MSSVSAFACSRTTRRRCPPGDALTGDPAIGIAGITAADARRLDDAPCARNAVVIDAALAGGDAFTATARLWPNCRRR